MPRKQPKGITSRTQLIEAILAAETEFDFFEIGRDLSRDDLWLFSDYVLLYEGLWAGKMELLAEALKMPWKTIASYRHTAVAFPMGHRTWDLPYSFYRIAGYSDDPAGWLDRAREGQWTARGLKDAIRKAEGRTARRKGVDKQVDSVV
jgi:hypothetical protein